jgi:hypothetical protein
MGGRYSAYNTQGAFFVVNEIAETVMLVISSG